MTDIDAWLICDRCGVHVDVTGMYVDVAPIRTCEWAHLYLCDECSRKLRNFFLSGAEMNLRNMDEDGDRNGGTEGDRVR